MFAFSKKRTSLGFRVGHKFADFKNSDLLELYPKPFPIPQGLPGVSEAMTQMCFELLGMVLIFQNVTLQDFHTPVGSTAILSNANVFELGQIGNWDILCSTLL